ncbi:MAG: hypothetical protein J5944_06515, partial [Lentisphaeria bacterium]|nr:hypothetical protein [Lentisphaeria bacterium]
MSLPEIIPSNLPVFVQNKNRSAFANSVIPSGAVLLFAESDGNGGSKLIAKNPDGSFSEVGGGSSMAFYKCASVGTGTWTGYLATIDSTTGVWSFASTATSGLTYDRITPVVGNVYDEECTFRASDFVANMVDEYTQFYISGNLTDQSPNHVAVSNEGLTFDGTKIICANNAYAYIPANTLPVTVLNEGYDWTVEIKFKCEDVSALGSRHGLFGNDGEIDQSGYTVRFDIFEYNNEFVTGSWQPVGGSGNMVVPWQRDTNEHILKYCHYASTGYIKAYLDGVLKVTGEKTDSRIRVYTREFMNPIGATGASTEVNRFGYPF